MSFNINDASSLRDSLLTIAKNKWQINKNDMLEHMSKIAYVESLGEIDAIQKLDDGSDGKGRGMFQYEMGKGQAGQTAVKRLTSLFGSAPSFLDGMIEKEFDFSGLSKEAQQSLFLADKLKDETASFKGINTDDKLKDFWFKEHYAGQDLTKLDLFDKQLKYYYNNKRR
tara:strand:+ start:616 stop:1122 length:507 start_codon:yes stop_codon:yes gene_type:complete